MAGTNMMLSAAGARNMQLRVRRKSGEESEKKYPGRITGSSSRKQVADNTNDANGNHQAHFLRRSMSAGSSSHRRIINENGRQILSSRGIEKYERMGPKMEKKKSQGKQEIKTNGLVGRKQRSTDAPPAYRRNPNLLSQTNKGPKALPSRALFRHRPRTWFGKVKKEKKEEDWRNARHSIDTSVKKTSGKEERGQEYKSSLTIESAGSVRSRQTSGRSTRGRERDSIGPSSSRRNRKEYRGAGIQEIDKIKEHQNKNQDMNGRSVASTQSGDNGRYHDRKRRRPVDRSRSRSIPSKATLATVPEEQEDEGDWRQYLVCVDSDWFEIMRQGCI